MKPRLFLDTNIILDLLGEREPFYDATAKLASLSDKNLITLVASPISFTTVNYILTKFETSQIVREKLRKFQILCEICVLDEHTIEKGLNSSFKDFEDSLQYFSAVSAECDIIITRNAKDFKSSHLPVMNVEEYLKSYMLK